MCLKSGGAMRDRTADLLNANQALSQLSYSPSSSLLFYTIALLDCTSLVSHILVYAPSFVACLPCTSEKSLRYKQYFLI